jgi:serine phosphatase RsbU (regulator of sigma subunit)
MVMGIDRGPIFDTTVQSRTFDLAPGDLVVFLSAGILEVRNPGREELGLERVHGAIQRYGNHEAEYLVHKLGQVLEDWSRGSEPGADACVAALKLAGAARKS